MSGPTRRRKRKGSMGMSKHRKSGRTKRNWAMKLTANEVNAMNELREARRRRAWARLYDTVQELFRKEK